MNDVLVIPNEDDDAEVVSAPTKKKRELTAAQREAKIMKDRERRAAKKAAPSAPGKVADKRLKAALILHQVPEVEAEKVVAKRTAKKATTMLPKKATAKPAAKPKAAKVKVKATKVAAKPKKASKPAPKAAKRPTSTAGDGKPLIMSHSYQRFGKVATGVEIKGGGRQTVVTFPKDMFKKVAAAAKGAGISFSEQVRRCVLKSVGA